MQLNGMSRGDVRLGKLHVGPAINQDLLIFLHKKNQLRNDDFERGD